MNETLQTLITRRSCRKYLSTPVEQEKVERVIEAGLYAPSGKGFQSPIIVAVTNSEVRRRLSKVNKEILEELLGKELPNLPDPFYGAPVFLAVIAPADRPHKQLDGSLTLGNMMNAAHAEGLGTCWIHRALQTFAMPEWKAWLVEIGLSPEVEYEGVGFLSLGYPDGEPAPAPARKEGRVVWVK